MSQFPHQPIKPAFPSARSLLSLYCPRTAPQNKVQMPGSCDCQCHIETARYPTLTTNQSTASQTPSPKHEFEENAKLDDRINISHPVTTFPYLIYQKRGYFTFSRATRRSSALTAFTSHRSSAGFSGLRAPVRHQPKIHTPHLSNLVACTADIPH